MLNVIPIPAFTDNYIWVIIHSPSQHCLIVDPGEATNVIAFVTANQLQPVGMLLTHHHADHVGGAADLQHHYPMPVYGSALENIPCVTHPLNGDEKLFIPELNLNLQVIAIPGHTLGHIAFYGENMLFCGDTLFTGGCGRIFEGTAPQMHASLQRLASLPDQTLVYCGHEYTQANLAFAQTLDNNNAQLAARIAETNALRDQGLPTVPATLGLEKLTNPFLRCDTPAISCAAQQQIGHSLSNSGEVFAAIRLLKNSFKFN